MSSFGREDADKKELFCISRKCLNASKFKLNGEEKAD